MRSDRRNMPEQELSIKEREQELFVEPSEPSAPPTSVKPFAFYLRETPANPLSTEVKAILWAIGLVVLLLFAVAIWRVATFAPLATEAAGLRGGRHGPWSPLLTYLCRGRDGTMTSHRARRLQQELRVDRLEAEPAADVLVVLLHERPQHHPFPLDLRVEHARPLRRRRPARPPCGPARASRAAAPVRAPSRPAPPASPRGRAAGRRPRSGR